MNRFRLIVAMFVGAGAPSAVAQDEPAPAPKRAKYGVLRFNEDWSVLRDWPATAPSDPWDALKFVPLSEDGETWASFGGHLRARVENWNGFGFAPQDDTFGLWRALAHADVHWGDTARVYVEGITAWDIDRDLPGGSRTIDVDSIDVEQAFVDWRIDLGDATTLTLRPGRQQFLFGRQRLVSPLPWANTFRRWDGVSAILETPGWRMHAFWSQYVPVRKYEFNQADAQTEFFGAYATTSLSGTALDLYALGYVRGDDVAFNGTTGREDRYTIGARVSGKVGNSAFDYDVEAAYQFGRVGAGDVSAYMIGSELGYTWADAWGRPRLSLGFDMGSGDDGAGGNVETFNQLFPLGHGFLGYVDMVGRQNVTSVNLGGTFTPTEKATVQVRGFWFGRASADDALYNAGGGAVRPGPAGSSRDIGAEIDVSLQYRFDRHLTGLVGYSHFFAGDFIEESGTSEDIDFVYGQLQYTF